VRIHYCAASESLKSALHPSVLLLERQGTTGCSRTALYLPCDQRRCSPGRPYIPHLLSPIRSGHGQALHQPICRSSFQSLQTACQWRLSWRIKHGPYNSKTPMHYLAERWEGLASFCLPGTPAHWQSWSCVRRIHTECGNGINSRSRAPRCQPVIFICFRAGQRPCTNPVMLPCASQRHEVGLSTSTPPFHRSSELHWLYSAFHGVDSGATPTQQNISENVMRRPTALSIHLLPATSAQPRPPNIGADKYPRPFTHTPIEGLWRPFGRYHCRSITPGKDLELNPRFKRTRQKKAERG
jgi:hypothetical protein